MILYNKFAFASRFYARMLRLKMQRIIIES